MTIIFLDVFKGLDDSLVEFFYLITSFCYPLSFFQFFIFALSFTYFCKALTGSYMKSSITQIERRFELSSSFAGLVDGGFEIGAISASASSENNEVFHF